MTAFPILFGYRDLITCRGFFAYVKADGRALLEEEEDGDQWLYGVYPGGIAGGGKERAEAARAFKKRYLSVLFDIAEEAEGFEDFKTRVREFFYAVNAPTAEAWAAAHAEVKNGKLGPEGMERVELEKRPLNIEVQLVRNEDAQPAQPSAFNTFDDPEYAEAA